MKADHITVKKILLAAGVGLGVYLIFLLLTAYLMVSGVIPQERMRICITLSAAAASFVSAMLTKGCVEKRIVSCALGSASLLAVILLGGLLVCGGVQGGGVITVLLAIVLGYVNALFIRSRKRKNKHRKHRST